MFRDGPGKTSTAASGGMAPTCMNCSMVTGAALSGETGSTTSCVRQVVAGGETLGQDDIRLHDLAADRIGLSHNRGFHDRRMFN